MAQRCIRCMHMSEERVCPVCGWPESGENSIHQLPVGTVLRGRYQIGRVLGQGGFGITYLAWDLLMNTQIAVKEFFPGGTVFRRSNLSTSVECITEEAVPHYNYSKERFLREARALVQFKDVPEVVDILDFISENNTSYIVMEYVRGVDLAKYIGMKGGRLHPDETFRILKPVMEALAKVHKGGIVHRDISPDNIILDPMGGAKLLDFGAVRAVEDPDVDKGLNKSTEAILKQGFAPIEQYNSRGSLGPWTDCYAMCATVWYCLTGEIPEETTIRMAEGIDPDWSTIEGLPEHQQKALAKGFQCRARDRYRSLDELLADLFPEEKPEKPAEEKPAATAKPVEEAPAKAVKEKTVREKAGKEKAVREKAVKEKTGKEKTVREKTGKEKTGKEKTGKEKAVKEKTGKEKAVKDKAVKEKAGKEKAGKEKAVKDKSVRGKAGTEKTGRETPKKKGAKIWTVGATAVLAVLLAVAVFLPKGINTVPEETLPQEEAAADTTPAQIQAQPTMPLETEPPTVPLSPEEEAYLQAEALLEEGKLGEAAIAFGKLSGYADARERSFEIWDRIAVRDTVSVGLWYTVGLRADGTVVAVGWNDFGQCDVEGWTDIVAVCAVGDHTVGLRADGTVIAVGTNDYGKCDVEGWTDIVAVSAGGLYTVGLRTDGTVVAVGYNEFGRCDVEDWTDIVAVSAGGYHTVGLRTDGTVVAVGENDYGQCDVSSWTDIVAVSARGHYTVGLRADGTVVAVGDNEYGQCDVEGWTEIVAVSTGGYHTVGLRADGTAVAVGYDYTTATYKGSRLDVDGWTDIVAISAGDGNTVGLRADGTVVAVGVNLWGECDLNIWPDILIPKERVPFR